MRKQFPRLICILLPACTSFASELYEVTVIGPVGTTAYAINNYGVVTGRIVTPTGQAFRWTRYSGMQPIGGLAGYAINNVGQIAGGFAHLTPGVWDSGQWVTLEGRQGAAGINDAGHVAGLISAQPAIPGPYAPYRDDCIHEPGFHTLERPYPRASHGKGINNNDEVIADCGAEPSVTGFLYVPVFYSADLSYTVMDFDGNWRTHPEAINDAGQVAGHTRVQNGEDTRAVWWDGPTAPLQYLGELGAGGSIARGMNNHGAIVGRSAGRAFLWRTDIGMRDLNDRIDPTLPILLEEAFDINDAGEIIVLGRGADDQEVSFLLSPSAHSLRTFSKPYETYCPGEDKIVRISLKVPPDTAAVGVEEQPPREWTDIVEVSDGGAYDAVNHLVKWGPFITPDIPSQISYRVAVPSDDDHLATFGGVVSLDGTPHVIAGEEYLWPADCPLMAADTTMSECGACTDCTCGDCGDGNIELCELIGYACQWYHGCHDDMAGLTRAGYVWLNGESYCWDDEREQWDPVLDDVDACGCCSETTSGPEPHAPAGPAAAGQLHVSLFDAKGQPLRVATVSARIQPAASMTAMALEITVPVGWGVVSIDDNGLWDPVHRKVKWGPFLGRSPDRLTCRVAPSQTALRARPRVDFAPSFRARVAYNGVVYPVDAAK